MLGRPWVLKGRVLRELRWPTCARSKPEAMLPPDWRSVGTLRLRHWRTKRAALHQLTTWCRAIRATPRKRARQSGGLRSAVVEEEIHQRGEHEKCQQEAEDVRTPAGFGGDWSVADRGADAAVVHIGCFRIRFSLIRLNCGGRGEISGDAEVKRARTRIYGECLPIHEYLDVSASARCGEGLRELGHKVLSHKTDQLFSEVTLDIVVGRYLDWLCVRVCRADNEAASGVALDMEGQFEVRIFEREFQAWEFRG